MSELYIGLLSGTSVDSIDAVLVDLTDDRPTLIASLNTPWPQTLRAQIFHTRSLADDELGGLQQLDIETGEMFARAANDLLQQAKLSADQIKAIGSHGQTIRHRPDIARPFSLQVGNARRIAELTNIDVISDFRKVDIEAGGQGAPLVPAFHQAVFRDKSKNRVIVNIGGISNITVLPKLEEKPVIGFDTGPGNNLMDAWIAQHRQLTFDRDGAFAASGRTDAKLLANMLMHEYFRQAPPKSTGFELFNLEWLNQYLDTSHDAADVESTLCDLTATSIIRAINQYAEDTDEIYVCGGGVHNSELMRRLRSISKSPVTSTQALGVDPDWVEAITFAWLAKRKLEDLPGNVPTVTGAAQKCVLGEITPAI